MPKHTAQMLEWLGSFGRDYTERNDLGLEELESLYQSNFGVTRTSLNEKFLIGIDRSARILEVGCNIGNQLLCLQTMGFANLFGIELQSYAVELAKQRNLGINIIQGSAFDIPFKEGYFDLVFTSGVLIHLPPQNLTLALREIHRLTKEYIWGFEYWAEECTPVTYRGQSSLLWKADFVRIYLDLFQDIELVKEERLKYRKGNNTDSMFLLRKKR